MKICIASILRDIVAAIERNYEKALLNTWEATRNPQRFIATAQNSVSNWLAWNHSEQTKTDFVDAIKKITGGTVWLDPAGILRLKGQTANAPHTPGNPNKPVSDLREAGRYI